MDIALVLALLAVACALTSVGFGIRIANDLRARGLQANPLMVRWMIFRYLSVYKRVTLEETGKVGPLYTVLLDRVVPCGRLCRRGDSDEGPLRRRWAPRACC